MRGSLVRCFTTAAIAVALTLPAAAATQLTGAGSSFDYPFFSKAFYVYNQQKPDVTINYQSIGSGGGIQQFTAKNVDFGATDVPMNADELARAGQPVLQIPVTLGGAAVAYNVPGLSGPIHLTRQIVADIYLGKILKWNDPRIAALNRGMRLPDMSIVVVHRSDGSGTSYIFTDFLSHVSPDWKSRVGTGKSVSWPAPSSVGAKGNEGVAGQVRTTPGAIGYVELAYVLENHMDAAVLQNRSGKWVACSTGTVAAAAATKPSVSPKNFSIVDSPGANSYPISGYSWIVVYKKPADAARAKLLYEVLLWLVGPQGQSNAKSVDYVPLPVNVQNAAAATLRQMQR
ncbi:MAG: phosphate ABC transporter substrate-binding protein PstS [Candidatus Eremiobacteraeota bacterium]|nr:phosphate ABC transporter substrate-binding protein PstS [Candidatus Eremiobacteraeota bacterium]